MKTATIRKAAGYTSLWIRYRGALEMVAIDYTTYGPEWNKNHGMNITEQITAEGITFDIWRGAGMASATPVRG